MGIVPWEVHQERVALLLIALFLFQWLKSEGFSGLQFLLSPLLDIA